MEWLKAKNDFPHIGQPVFWWYAKQGIIDIITITVNNDSELMVESMIDSYFPFTELDVENDYWMPIPKPPVEKEIDND